MEEIRKFIAASDAVLITAGAGMGVDSGLPDFRGDEGFWKHYPVMKKRTISFQEIANPKWFQSDPSLAWAFYGHRLQIYRSTNPHKGFNLLLDLVKRKNENYFIYTSNVDGQFQKAGFDDKKIVEIHGSIHQLQCTHNCTTELWDAKDEHIEIDFETFKAKNVITCKNCTHIARPNILMFNDWQWNENQTLKQEKAFEIWLDSVVKTKKKLVIIEIGAGTVIPSVRFFSESIVRGYKNSKLIRINPKDFEVDKSLGVSIPYGGLEGLQKIL